MWLVQYVFSISVFSEYWCSTVTFSLLRDLDLGNLFYLLILFFTILGMSTKLHASHFQYYTLYLHTLINYARILRVHETGQCSFICLFILTPMRNYVRWEECYI